MKPSDDVRVVYLDALRQMLTARGYQLLDVITGCESECAPPSQWPTRRLVAFGIAWLAAEALIQISGALPTITSGYRCEPCNRRRDGAELSRHLGETAGGKPYAAYDLQWSSWRPVIKIIDWLQGDAGRLANVLQSWIGVRVNVGIIVYSSSPRIHIDIRANGNYLKIHDGVPRGRLA